MVLLQDGGQSLHNEIPSFPPKLETQWSTKGIKFIRHWEAKRGPADTDLGKVLWDGRRWDHISKWTLVKKVMARAGAREAFSRRDPLVGDVLSSPTPRWCRAAERNSVCKVTDLCRGRKAVLSKPLPVSHLQSWGPGPSVKEGAGREGATQQAILSDVEQRLPRGAGWSLQLPSVFLHHWSPGELKVQTCKTKLKCSENT